MTGFIQTYATWRNVLILIGIIALINILLVLSFGQNPDFKPLDLQLSYTPEEAYAWISGYSDSERSMYLLIELTLDILYPVVYSFAICFALFLFFGKPKLAQLPLLLIFLDLIENGFIVFVLLNYPTKHDWLVQMASFFTSSKWTLAAISFTLLLLGAIRFLFMRRKGNTQPEV